MDGRVIAIGDIHGCVDALRAVVGSIQPALGDTLVTLGDYVDRGPRSKQVIDFLIKLKSVCNLVCIHGNHEEMMTDVIVERNPPYDWLRYGGVDTLDSYGFTGDVTVVPTSHLEFLESLVPFYETDSHFFVHANYDPTLPLDDQPIDLLRWIKLTDIVPGPHRNGKIAIVGHTHHREGEIFQLPHLVCLDTYCYGGKWLTAMDVATGELWQSDMSGKLREKAESQ